LRDDRQPVHWKYRNDPEKKHSVGSLGSMIWPGDLVVAVVFVVAVKFEAVHETHKDTDNFLS
jgi:hypothetical protein